MPIIALCYWRNCDVIRNVALTYHVRPDERLGMFFSSL